MISGASLVHLSTKVSVAFFKRALTSMSGVTANNMASKSSLFEYTHAITCGIPQSFGEYSLKLDVSQKITVSRAIQQFEKYVDVLKQCGLKVVTLPADERFPDCPFVEDAAVVIGQTACITRPGHESRRGEVVAMKNCLQSLGFETQELDDHSALLDGGDVLFTGQEIFVGLSARTNKQAVENLQRIFSEFPVTGIPVSAGDLHLKSSVTLAEDGVLVVGGSRASQEMFKDLRSKAHGQYRFIHLNHDKSSNMLFLNGQAVIKSEENLGHDDFEKLTKGLTVPWKTIDFDEFYKADGCLTCCSVLLKVPEKMQ